MFFEISAYIYNRICTKNNKNNFEIRRQGVLNIRRYLKNFYTYMKINDIFLTFYHSLPRMPTFKEIG